MHLVAGPIILQSCPLEFLQLKYMRSPFSLDKSTYIMRVSAAIFPVLASVIALVTIFYCYLTARQYNHVPPFPKTDITHTGIQYPEYIIMRVGFICILPLIFFGFKALRARLNRVSMRQKGCLDPRATTILKLGILSGFLLAFSTAAISDGKTNNHNDMNWTLHTICATGFFVVQLYATIILKAIVADLSQHQPIFSDLTMKWLNSVHIFVVALLGMAVLSGVKIIDLGSIPELLGTVYLLVGQLLWGLDLQEMNVVMVRVK